MRDKNTMIEFIEKTQGAKLMPWQVDLVHGLLWLRRHPQSEQSIARMMAARNGKSALIAAIKEAELKRDILE